MAKDSAGANILVGRTVKFVGTVTAISEPDQSNQQNVWVTPNNPTISDNNGNVTGANNSSFLFDGSLLTNGQ